MEQICQFHNNHRLAVNRRRIKPCQIPSSPWSAFPCLASSRPLTQSPAPALFSQLSAGSASVDVLDNGNTASLLANLKTAFNLISQGRLTAIRVFTASGTYTPSAGTKRIKVTVIGGGGGGGGSAATDANTRSYGGGGGGAGNTAISMLDISSLTLPVSINVGTAGAAGAAGGRRVEMAVRAELQHLGATLMRQVDLEAGADH